jgi:AcrR family transcriptional regulator
MPRPPRFSENQLADAAVRLVAERGLAAMSVRAVAREAGVSGGAVQYYFPTVDALLRAAYRRVIDGVTERAVRLPPSPTAKGFVRSLLHELLPLDEQRETELRVALAFSARAPFEPALAELYTEGYRALLGALEEALRQGIALGEAAPGVDPRRDAVACAAVADGLAWHLLCAPSALAREEVVRALDSYLDRLLPG